MDKLKPITLFLIIIFSIYFLCGCSSTAAGVNTISQHGGHYGGVRYTSQYTSEELAYLKSYYGHTPTLKREPYGYQRELERWEFLHGESLINFGNFLIAD